MGCNTAKNIDIDVWNKFKPIYEEAEALLKEERPPSEREEEDEEQETSRSNKKWTKPEGLIIAKNYIKYGGHYQWEEEAIKELKGRNKEGVRAFARRNIMGANKSKNVDITEAWNKFKPIYDEAKALLEEEGGGTVKVVVAEGIRHWQPPEIDRFIEAVLAHGFVYPKIAEIVGTKDEIQCRSFAFWHHGEAPVFKDDEKAKKRWTKLKARIDEIQTDREKRNVSSASEIITSLTTIAEATTGLVIPTQEQIMEQLVLNPGLAGMETRALSHFFAGQMFDAAFRRAADATDSGKRTLPVEVCRARCKAQDVPVTRARLSTKSGVCRITAQRSIFRASNIHTLLLHPSLCLGVRNGVLCNTTTMRPIDIHCEQPLFPSDHLNLQMNEILDEPLPIDDNHSSTLRELVPLKESKRNKAVGYMPGGAKRVIGTSEWSVSLEKLLRIVVNHIRCAVYPALLPFVKPEEQELMQLVCRSTFKDIYSALLPPVEYKSEHNKYECCNCKSVTSMSEGRGASFERIFPQGGIVAALEALADAGHLREVDGVKVIHSLLSCTHIMPSTGRPNCALLCEEAGSNSNKHCQNRNRGKKSLRECVDFVKANLLVDGADASAIDVSPGVDANAVEVDINEVEGMYDMDDDSFINDECDDSSSDKDSSDDEDPFEGDSSSDDEE